MLILICLSHFDSSQLMKLGYFEVSQESLDLIKILTRSTWSMSDSMIKQNFDWHATLSKYADNTHSCS